MSSNELGINIKSTYKFILSELKPKSKIITHFNVIAFIIIAIGAVLIVLRFVKGLGAVTNLSQEYPWGIWIGFDVITGVAFAGGAYSLCFIVYILGDKKYKPIIRVTVLNGFLAYVFYAGALLLDLGKPWNVINPIIGNSFGVSSVMFLVAWHFMLYMLTELVEISPAFAEWLGWRKVRKYLHGLTLGAVILGITLSTLHQSGLGALFLMAKNKIHPLWYSEFIPILFFVSSIFAGLSMVIVEGSISHKVFKNRMSDEVSKSHNSILFGLAKICAVVLYVYLFLKLLLFIHGEHWVHLNSQMGVLWLVEMIGFVALPCVIFTQAFRYRNELWVKIGGIITMLGIILNRLNVSVIAFKWYAADRYFPSWMEIEITLAIIFLEILVLRWIIHRMPILSDSPVWVKNEKH
ncbi:MAG: Ni/Fe-hydrogenase cytochrome b subunit [Bacteroidetes bacterium]|nr:Ni/Fe-hydrogenase cytochrome b subunit [Bacteroidota bacterium]MBU1677841.1 Ni/Fe-hydrogenase cytochrome b subunit [Bacteroidota bacterium]MBU2506512.1 Ni/Fe-hydrogenase cytochrome b subunit [Bacteroidota bacterium]